MVLDFFSKKAVNLLSAYKSELYVGTGVVALRATAFLLLCTNTNILILLFTIIFYVTNQNGVPVLTF